MERYTVKWSKEMPCVLVRVMLCTVSYFKYDVVQSSGAQIKQTNDNKREQQIVYSEI